MKELPKSFRKNGFSFRQIERNGHAAIYGKLHDSGGSETFEVIRVRQQPERQAFGRTFEAGEAYPRSEQWGELAWTYPDLASARRRYATLTPRKPALGNSSTQI